jgi:hypothetical protein
MPHDVPRDVPGGILRELTLDASRDYQPLG